MLWFSWYPFQETLFWDDTLAKPRSVLKSSPWVAPEYSWIGQGRGNLHQVPAPSLDISIADLYTSSGPYTHTATLKCPLSPREGRTTTQVLRVTLVNPGGLALPAGPLAPPTAGCLSGPEQGMGQDLPSPSGSGSPTSAWSQNKATAGSRLRHLGWSWEGARTQKPLPWATSWLWSQEHVQLLCRPDWACRLSPCQPLH